MKHKATNMPAPPHNQRFSQKSRSNTKNLKTKITKDIAPDGEVEARALEWARKVAAMPPVPARMTKKTINAYSNALADLTVHMDTEEVILTETTQDHAEAVDAFFARKPPRFTGG